MTPPLGLVDQELLVLLRAEETAKGVFLHQGVDPLLSQIEGGRGEIHQVPQGHVFGDVVDVHLMEGNKNVRRQRMVANRTGIYKPKK